MSAQLAELYPEFSAQAAVFDESYYTTAYPEVLEFGIPPFLHYCLYGQAEGRLPSSDTRHDAMRSGSTERKGASPESGDPKFFGVSHTSSVPSEAHAADDDVSLNRARGIFDPVFYEEQLPRDEQIDDPFQHFLDSGWKQGLDPNYAFSVRYYLGQNKDVSAAGLNPLLHYVRSGEKEGRAPHPGFDPAYYLASNADLKRSDVGALAHYLSHGAEERRRPSASFHPGEYALSSGMHGDDVSEAFEHYLKFAKHARPSGNATKIDKLLPLVHFFPLEDWESVEQRNGFSATSLTTRRSRYDAEKVRKSASTKNNHAQTRTESVDKEFVQRVIDASKGKVLSLDIWDTVLRRDCFPDEIKLRTARALWLNVTGRQGRFRGLHPADLFNIRRILEAKLANEDGEYTLPDVIAEWAKLAGSSAAQHDKLVDCEIAIEKSATSLDPTVSEIIEKHDGRIVGVSDFYMSSKKLEDLLHVHNVTKVRKVYSSCDHGVSKRSGRLFLAVKDEEEVASEGLVHVGDNEVADFEIPRSLGIPAFLFSPSDHERRRSHDHARFWSFVDGDETAHACGLANSVGFDVSGGLDKVPLAAMAIPLCGFVLRVLEASIREGVSHASFFAREGIFFKEIYDRLVQEDVYDLGRYPESELLEVSRRATFCPSMRRFSIAELMRMWSLYSTQSIRTLLNSLNIDAELLKAQIERHAIELDKEVKHPWLDDQVVGFLTDVEVVTIAEGEISRQQKELTAYLGSTAFGRKGVLSKVIVDIGWRGTIQDNLANLTLGNVAGVYFGLDKFLNRQPRNSTKQGYLFDRNAGDDFLVREYAALEFLCNGPGGSVRTYVNGAAVKDVIAAEETFFEKSIRPLQLKLLSAASAVAKYVRSHGLVSDDLRWLSRTIVSSYMDEPPEEVAFAFSNLLHNESFGAGSLDDMSASVFEESFARQGADLHGSLRAAGQHARWLSAHLRAPRLSELKGSLSPSSALNLPSEYASSKGLMNAAGERATIAVYAPEPIRGSGGHRTIYNIARHLSDLGAKVHLLSERPGSIEAQQWMSDVIPDDVVTKHYAWTSFDNADIAIATIDYSAGFLRDRFKGRVPILYLIQDYEAQFNPVGDNFLSSQLSYALSDHHFTVGSWLGHVMYRDYGVKAASGGLGIDADVYRRVPETKKKKQIAFLYQPEKPRRASGMCLRALRMVRERVPDVRIVSYGSSSAPPADFISVDHHGLIDDLAQLNDLYNESLVGLCISGTNPSRVPFEMMAAGCVPVDLYRYNNLFDYKSGSAVLALQSPDSIAEAICRLLTEPSYCMKRANAGIEYVKHRTLQWECDVLSNAARMILNGTSFDTLTPPRITYTEAPVVARSSDTEAMRNFLQFQREMAIE